MTRREARELLFALGGSCRIADVFSNKRMSVQDRLASAGMSSNYEVDAVLLRYFERNVLMGQVLPVFNYQIASILHNPLTLVFKHQCSLNGLMAIYALIAVNTPLYGAGCAVTTPPPPHSRNPRAPQATRDQHLQAREAGIRYKDIAAQTDITFRQIRYALVLYSSSEYCKNY